MKEDASGDTQTVRRNQMEVGRRHRREDQLGNVSIIRSDGSTREVLNCAGRIAIDAQRIKTLGGADVRSEADNCQRNFNWAQCREAWFAHKADELPINTILLDVILSRHFLDRLRRQQRLLPRNARRVTVVEDEVL